MGAKGGSSSSSTWILDEGEGEGAAVMGPPAWPRPHHMSGTPGTPRPLGVPGREPQRRRFPRSGSAPSGRTGSGLHMTCCGVAEKGGARGGSRGSRCSRESGRARSSGLSRPSR